MPTLDLSFARMPAQVAAVLGVTQATELRRQDAIRQRRRIETVAAASASGETGLDTAEDTLRHQAQRDDALQHHLVDREA
jgi:hypothetical protein